MHKLGNRLTACEVGVFSREISQLLKMRPPPLFEEPHAHRPSVYFREITLQYHVPPIPLSEELHKFVAHECHIYERLKCLLLSATTHTH